MSKIKIALALTAVPGMPGKLGHPVTKGTLIVGYLYRTCTRGIKGRVKLGHYVLVAGGAVIAKAPTIKAVLAGI